MPSLPPLSLAVCWPLKARLAFPIWRLTSTFALPFVGSTPRGRSFSKQRGAFWSPVSPQPQHQDTLAKGFHLAAPSTHQHTGFSAVCQRKMIMLCASCRIINYNRRATKKNTILCNKGNGLQSLFNYPKQKLVSYLLAITGANAVSN